MGMKGNQKMDTNGQNEILEMLKQYYPSLWTEVISVYSYAAGKILCWNVKGFYFVYDSVMNEIIRVGDGDDRLDRMNNIPHVTEEQLRSLIDIHLNQDPPTNLHRNRTVLEMRLKGKSIMEISKVVDISTTRVWQIIKEYEEIISDNGYGKV